MCVIYQQTILSTVVIIHRQIRVGVVYKYTLDFDPIDDDAHGAAILRVLSPCGNGLMFRVRTFKYYVNMNCIAVEHDTTIRNPEDTHQYLMFPIERDLLKWAVDASKYVCSPGNGPYMLFMSVLPAKGEKK